jgi:hypothetical protein
MNTYLGACVELGPEDVEAEKASRAPRSPISKAICGIRRAPRMRSAHRSPRACRRPRSVDDAVGFSFCVDRYRDEFLDLMRSGMVDIVFANSHEIKSLYQTSVLRDGARHDPQGLQDRGGDPLRKGLGDRARRRDGDGQADRRSARSSTRPAPATSTPPASSTATPRAAACRTAAISARWRPAWSSSRSGRARARICARRRSTPACSDHNASAAAAAAAVAVDVSEPAAHSRQCSATQSAGR